MRPSAPLACLAVLAAGLGSAVPAQAQEHAGEPIVSPFNGHELIAGVHDEPFSLLLGGHLMGSVANAASVFPSASLLANVDRLAESPASAFIALGDIVRYPSPQHLELFRKSFAERLPMPLFNAVGNHELADPARYWETYGSSTYFSFVHGRALFVFLDTELAPGTIQGNQRDWWSGLLEWARSAEDVRVLLVFSHKLIWTDGRPDFQVVLDNVNHPQGYQRAGSFAQLLLPPLRRLSTQKPIYWFSGDIGAASSLPLFYHREPGGRITWVAAGIGDTPQDALVEATVQPDGQVSFEVLRMDGRPAPPLEDHDLAWWKKLRPPPPEEEKPGAAPSDAKEP